MYNPAIRRKTFDICVMKNLTARQSVEVLFNLVFFN